MLTVEGGTWTVTSQPPLPKGNQVASICAAPDGTVWAAGTGGKVFSFQSATWTRVSAPHTFPQIAVANATIGAGLNAGTVWLYSNGSWSSLGSEGLNGESVVAISTMAGEGAIFALTTSGMMYLYAGQWVPAGSPTVQLTGISAGRQVWGIIEGGTPTPLAVSHGWMSGTAYAVMTANRAGPEWDNENPFSESLSTHLWLVNRAAQLAVGAGALGQEICDLIMPGQPKQSGDTEQDIFHNNLCQALYDADFLPEYIQKRWFIPTYSSHFYDTRTGRNWLLEKSPSALTCGREYFNRALEGYQEQDWAKAGYALGLSLHYLGDVTQPMHASSFTFLDSFWLGYHSGFEAYAMGMQSSPWVMNALPTQYTPIPPNLTSAEEFIKSAAETSRTKYFSTLCPLGSYYQYYFGMGPAQRAQANKVLPGAFSDAITILSQFMVFWMQNASASAAQRSATVA